MPDHVGWIRPQNRSQNGRFSMEVRWDMSTELFQFRAGRSPLMLSIPHAGTTIPSELTGQMTPMATELRDTDWFVPALYDFPELELAGCISAQISRYVVDLNRPPDNQSLYPGQNTTGLCPLTTFAGQPLYRDQQEPSPEEISARVQTYWMPYHSQLQSELNRMVAEYGFAVLLDAHTIANEIPRLFEGVLPDFNFGTNHGRSCSPGLQTRIESFATSMSSYSAVVNQRFVGGYITRHYGESEFVDAVQIELSQATYMDQNVLTWDETRSANVRPVIQSFVRELLLWIKSRS